jgi:multidrug efflux pump subunit AcrB
VSAKNAILIVEFAEERVLGGMNAFDAAIEAARLRLRPILMTSLAFIFGVMPLAISTGAGAGGQNAIGRAVVGGMFSATVLAIFFVPMFFVVVSRLFNHGQEDKNKPCLNKDVEPEGGNKSSDGGVAPQGA